MVRPRDGAHDGAYGADDDTCLEGASEGCDFKANVKEPVCKPGRKVKDEGVDHDVEDKNEIGRLRTCKSGLMDMLSSERSSDRIITPAQVSMVEAISIPGTSQTAAATAMAVTIQRRMNFMATSWSKRRQ